jgi:Ras-related C3 botulinum toxin substrate 1
MADSDDFDLDNVDSLKCMVIGDAAVGKTCLLISYSNNEFPKEYNPTVFDNYSANVVFKEKTVALGLWDTAGTDEYDQLRPLSYPDTHIFIIVFSIVSQESLNNIEKKWVPEIKEHTKDGAVPFIVVGNKLDLRNDEKMKDKCVNRKEAEKLAAKLGAKRYIECSAKTQENLKLVFDTCIEVVHDAYTKSKKDKGKKKTCKQQ